MVLKRLGHVVLKVRDLDRSEAFYTDVVGLRLTGRLPPLTGRDPLPFDLGSRARR